MTERVLFVDDDPQILNAFRRGLRKRLDLHTAEGGKAGLEALEKEGPFAVVVSDQQMPEMDGITLLREVKNRAPLTVRMMLTGNADQGTAAAAVNEGHIFRFLTKPCTPDELAAAVDAAKEQYRLVTAERDLRRDRLRHAARGRRLVHRCGPDMHFWRPTETARALSPVRSYSSLIRASRKTS